GGALSTTSRPLRSPAEAATLAAGPRRLAEAGGCWLTARSLVLPSRRAGLAANLPRRVLRGDRLRDRVRLVRVRAVAAAHVRAARGAVAHGAAAGRPRGGRLPRPGLVGRGGRGDRRARRGGGVRAPGPPAGRPAHAAPVRRLGADGRRARGRLLHVVAVAVLIDAGVALAPAPGARAPVNRISGGGRRGGSGRSCARSA